jgi:adenine/guanine phosphoribosyltransferase-like PRPP-binding protein
MAKYKNPWTRPDLIDEAQRRLELFIKKIKTLIEESDFDLILAPGNSGVFMAKITSMTYNYIGKSAPLIIKIPLYLKDRMGGRIKFDNSVLIPDVKRQIERVKKIRKILIVDDELTEKNPATVRASIELLTAAGKIKMPDLTVFVIAEGQTGSLKLAKSFGKICYLPFAKASKEWMGVYNFVSYSIPWEIQSKIREFYSDSVLNSGEIFCLLLGEPIRSKGKLRRGKPYFSYVWNNAVKNKIRDFGELQKEFKSYIMNLIKDA